MQFVDAVRDVRPEAAALIDRLGKHIPENGVLHVDGGTDDEMMCPLDVAPSVEQRIRDADGG